MLSEKWQLGNYTFTINPNKYSENISYIGDNIVTLNGTFISQPTVLQEQYNFSATLFQGMPRILNQVSVPNGRGVEMLSGNYYVLNNATKSADQYNPNFSLLKSTNIMSGNTNLVAFDIEPNGTIIAIDDSPSQILYTVTQSGTQTSGSVRNLDSAIQGIKYDSGNLWSVTNGGILYKTDMSFNISNQITLPSFPSSDIGYQGMTFAGDYLVVSFNNSDKTGVYHIDKSTGNIVNSFSLPNYTPVVDVAFDGTNFIFMTQNNSQLVFTNGNTLLADIYTIEKNIKYNGFLYMTDDMSVQRKVTVSDYSIDRVEGYLTMYNIQLTVTKIDRG